MRRLVVLLLITAGIAGGAGPLAGPAGPAQAAPAAQVAQEQLTYDYNYSTGIVWPQAALWSPAAITTMVTNDFRYYFPFDSNCARLPAVGGRCDLYSAGTVNPVQVSARTATGWTFRSLAGHAEGAGRFISFQFYSSGSGQSAEIRLRATGWGPWTTAAYLTIVSGAAYSFWQDFADNVGADF